MKVLNLGGLTPMARRRALALIVVLTAQFIFSMDLLIVVVALPQIQQDLGFSSSGLTWVLNAFALAFGGLLLLGGRLGDMIGQVRAFRVGLVIFVAASLVGGCAQTPGLLVTSRVFQGIGAALAGPSVLALVVMMARTPTEQARGMAFFIVVSSIGASAGLVLGGVLTEFLTWRWSLLINVPIGALVILAVGRLVPETHPKQARLDIAGALSSTLGSVALVYGFISAAERGWTAPITSTSFLAGAILLVVFLRTELQHVDPLLDLKLLRNRSRLGGLAVMALVVGVHFSVLFILVQYFQQVLGYKPLVAGLAYMPLTITVFAVSQLIPRLIHRFGLRTLLVTGSLLVAISLLGFALLDERARYVPGVLIPLLIHAVGISLVFAPGTVAIMRGIPDEHAGAASGLLQMDQQIGGALGIAVVTSIYALTAAPGHYTSGLLAAFSGGAILAVFAAIIAWNAFDRRSEAT